LFGDSKRFDESRFAGTCDLVFVDGSHARSYVESDSRKALRMLRPGGIVLWHDYHGPRRARGVFDALNALAGELPLAHIKGTSLVAYRRR
jgi:predicted O-methyltransferase YrrM